MHMSVCLSTFFIFPLAYLFINKPTKKLLFSPFFSQINVRSVLSRLGWIIKTRILGLHLVLAALFYLRNCVHALKIVSDKS